MSHRLSDRSTESNESRGRGLETLDLPEQRQEFPKFDLEEHAHSKSYWWVWLIILGVVGYGCYRLYNFENSKKAEMQGAKAAMPARSVSVVVAAARSGSMPVYLDGLGTVTASNTVTVKPRVDGQLLSVSFQEGQ